LPKHPATVYYIVTSVSSRVIPEEAIDVEQGIPSHVTVQFRVIDHAETEEQFQNELAWLLENSQPYLVFDTR
jgi:hypothetical protein